MITKYKPQTSKPRPWDDIEEHYVDLNKHGWGHDRLLELVRHIKSKGLSTRLFACTSLDNLIVTIYDAIEWHRETLHIEFDRHRKEWHFKYFAKPNEEPEFVRKYEETLGIEKFDKFIESIKW